MRSSQLAIPSQNLQPVVWVFGKLSRLWTFSVFLMLTVCLVDRGSSTCIFDDLKSSSIVHRPLAYTPGHRSRRAVESNSSSLGFTPIRISASYYDLQLDLTDAEMDRLQSVVGKAIEKIRQTLSVLAVSGPLLLGRSSSACGSIWRTGPNAGKCAAVSHSYRGETCLDNFQIPSDHLDGLSVWNKTDPDPFEAIAPGTGVFNTDYLLYVQALARTVQCLQPGHNVIAYAKYCQLDQNSRPIAGYINVCPPLLRDPDYSDERIVLVILHELLHALGFSSQLFDKYQTCTMQGSHLQCMAHRNTVRNVAGAMRFVTPQVVQCTSKHFSCITHPTVNEFGPALQTQNGQVQSHWDAAFMYTSLMTPSVGQVWNVVLDPITLALFDDMGWYHVNYQEAGNFTWGDSEGCSFGLNPHCESNGKYFCSDSDSGLGCDYGHHSKAECKTSTFLHGCKVHSPYSQGLCTDTACGDMQSAELTGEVCSTNSRCFVGNLTKALTGSPGSSRGLCYQHRCTAQGGLELKVGEELWQPCPWGSLVQVPSYEGYVTCPSAGRLCTESVTATPPQTSGPSSTEPGSTGPDTITTPSTATVATATAVYSTTAMADNFLLSPVEICFAELSYQTLHGSGVMTFKECVKVTLERAMNVDGRIHNILVFDMVDDDDDAEYTAVRFDLHPSMSNKDGPATSTVLQLLTESVELGNLSVPLYPGGPLYAATSVRLVTSVPASTLQPSGNPASNAGVIAAVSVSVVACTALVAFLMFMVKRHAAKRTPCNNV